MRCRKSWSKKGFTLVELIVVLVILGILAAVTVPALSSYIGKSKEDKAVTEAQACVTAGTGLGAEKYSRARTAALQNVSADANTADAVTTALKGWASDVTDNGPALTGTLAQTEGQGQYFLKPGNLPESSAAVGAANIKKAAGVDGTVLNFWCSSTGQIVYLSYRSADGIEVAYTNKSASGGSGVKIPTVTVPTAKPSTPTPAPVTTPTPAVEPLVILVTKTDSESGKTLGQAQFSLLQNNSKIATLTSSATGSSTLTISAAGNYILHEDTPPAGYKAAADVAFSVSVSADGTKLELSSSDSRFKGNNLTIQDEPIYHDITIYAVDENRKSLSMVPMSLRGNGLDNQQDWVTNATGSGKKVSHLRSGSYIVQLQDSCTDYEVPCSFSFTIADDGTLKPGDGTGFVQGSDVYLICTKSEDGLILTGTDITVKITGIPAWPATDANKTQGFSVKAGDYYYYDRDGKREYYAVCPAKGESSIDGWWAADPSGTFNSVANRALDKKTKVWTDSTLGRYHNASKVLDVAAGDLYVSDGHVYMASGYSHNSQPWNDPTKDMSRWVDITNRGPYKITITYTSVPVTVQLVDSETRKPILGYDVVLVNPNVMQSAYDDAPQHGSGTTLRYWKISNAKESFNLSPGTYVLSRINNPNLSEVYKNYTALDETFTVSAEGPNTIIIPLKLLTRTATIKLIAQPNGQDEPIAGVSVSLTGKTYAGTQISRVAKSDSNGIVTFEDLPYSDNNYYKYSVNLENYKNKDKIKQPDDSPAIANTAGWYRTNITLIYKQK